MSAKITDDLQRAADAQADEPLAAPHDGTRKLYYVYTEQMHQKASRALRQQEDDDAIQAGIDAMEAGDVVPFEEVDARIRKKLGLPDRA